jgi:hypothetical protein
MGHDRLAAARHLRSAKEALHMLAGRDRTAWLGMRDSNSEMSAQNIPLKARTDFRESNRFLATETIRVWAAASGTRSSSLGPGSQAGFLRGRLVIELHR